VWRRLGEEYNPECVVPTVQHGGGGIMIWGCMAASGAGYMALCEGRMNFKRYEAMLDKTLKPSIDYLFEPRIRPTVYFQQDNAPCHRTPVMKKILGKQKISLLEFPSRSPDLNPIENLWKQLKTSIAKQKPTSKAELIETIKREWKNISSRSCEKLVNNMPQRVAAVLKAKGKITKY
jgi:transposase